MILPDVNVLVYAFRREAPDHRAYAGWLSSVLDGAEGLALHDTVLSGFLRVATHPRLTDDPAPAAIALQFVSTLRGATRSRWLPAGNESWGALGRLVEGDRAIRADLVPDAYLAALAMTHGCRLATADRGFARFPGLRWFDPVS